MAGSDCSDTPVRMAPLPEEEFAPIDGALDRLRDLAHGRPHELPEDPGEASSPVGQLLTDAEQIVYEVLEEAARFRERALSQSEQLRIQGEREAASLLDEARATANRLRAEGERGRANVLDQARVAAGQARARAEAEGAALVRAAEDRAHDVDAEAQRDRAALLQGARAEVERLRAGGQDERAALLDAAHAEAERLRQQAQEEAATLLATCRAEAEEVRAAAEAEAERATAGDGTARSPRPPLTPMHSSEIGARQFPRGWRGLEPAPVQKWLSLVESSQATLEDEVDRLQAAWDDAVDCLARLKMRLATLQMTQSGPNPHELEHARDEWEQAARALAGGARSGGSRSTFESLLVRHAMLETPIRRRLFGYAKAEVDRLLASSATQLARLENRASILMAENQQLRERVLAQASWSLPIQVGDSSAERRPLRSLPRASDPAPAGADDQVPPQH